mgnify:CR=1 FL=1
MPQRETKNVFVPQAFEGTNVAEISACYKQVGDSVSIGDAICGLRDAVSGSEINLISPYAGTILHLDAALGQQHTVGSVLAQVAHVPANVPSEVEPRSESAIKLAGSMPNLLVLAIALPALAIPMLWLPLTLLAAFFSYVTLQARQDVAPSGAVEQVLVPFKFVVTAARCGFAGLNPARLIRGSVITAFCFLGACALASLAGVAMWVVAEGLDGALASTRLALYEYTPQLFAFLVCIWITGNAIRRRTTDEVIRAYALRLPEPALAVGPAVLVVLLLLVLFAAPSRSSWPASSGEALLSGAPPIIRDTFIEQRSVWVENNSEAVTRCMFEQSVGAWIVASAGTDPTGAPWVSIAPAQGETPSDRSQFVLLVALQNQLSPFESATVVVRRGPIGDVRFSPGLEKKLVRNLSEFPDNADSLSDKRIKRLATHRTYRHDIDAALRCSAATL